MTGSGAHGVEGRAPAGPADVGAILRMTRARPPGLHRGHLVCVDGPAGSGKTTLAQALVRDGGHVVHLDDLYPGWDGLAHVEPLVLGLLEPLSRGRSGHYRRWDWERDAPAEDHRVRPGDLLVLEGVASGNRAWAAWVSTLVWVEAPAPLRLDRGLDRDGREVRDQWVAWQVEEAALFERERTRERADVLVDGTLPYAGAPPPG